MKVIPVTIPSGSSLSGPIDLCGQQVTGMIMPEIWTSAALTFSSSLDGQNWRNMFNMLGIEVSAAASEGQHIVADSPFPVSWDSSDGSVLNSWKLKLRSGTSASPVAQTQDATILLVVK